jgi:hypothetical protein|tara:strand:+ start:887 stop:1501 length:615 start_codon:yes stop_codon:yes gene_type:complete
MSSFYELLNNGTKFNNRRFIDTFSGKQLDTTSNWTLNQISSGCTATLGDSVNGGLKMATDDGSSPSASLTFGAFNQFKPFASSIVGNCKKGQTNIGIKYGLANDNTVTPPSCALMAEGSFVSYRTLQTNDESNTASDVALGTDWFDFKIDMENASCYMYLDGILKVSKTTNIPLVELQPFLYIQSRSTAAVKYWNTTYCEAWNH